VEVRDHARVRRAASVAALLDDVLVVDPCRRVLAVST
jgi:hypothetical protein